MTTVTFDPAVGGNGLQVSDQAGEVNTLVLGGHRQFFVPALQQTVAVAGSAVASASSAASSANTASNKASEASASALSASQSAANAAASKLSAEANAASALASKQASDVSASAALASEQLAATKASEAATSALSASQSASAASVSANSAAASATLAEGYKNLSEQFAAAAQSTANYLGDWSADSTYSKGQSVSYGNYIYVSKIDSNLNQIPDVAATAWFEIKTEADLFRQPVAISPVTGTSGALPNLTLEATAFAALYSVDTRIHRRFEVALLSDASFSSPVFTAEVNSDSVTVAPNLDLNTAYHWRCKDVATTGESAWMLANSFVTGDISISTPTVSVSGAPSDVPESPTISTSAFATIPAGEDTHLSTDWEVRKSNDNTLVWSSYSNTTDKLSIVVPAGVLEVSTSYKFRVRHNGNNFGSSAYAEVAATTVPSFFDVAGDVDNLTSLVTIQQEWNPSTTYAAGNIVIIRYGNTRFVEYKSLTSGNINNNPVSSPIHWELIFDNNKDTAGYFGEVLGSACVVDKGEWNSTTTYNVGDMVVVKNIPTPLTQSDLTAYVALTGSNRNKNPATNPSDWVMRNGLPTGTSLAQTLGIGNTTPEVLINNDSGWLKFVHKGKIKYVAKKPFMHTVSWNDIAKAEAVYGNRTVRIGGRLFRVSLLSGAEADPSSWTTSSTATDNKGAGSEWNELIYRVHTDVPTDGTTTNHGGKQVGSNWWNFNNTDIVVGAGNGRSTLCQETLSYDTAGRVVRGYGSLSTFGNFASSYTDTSLGWRPCLTLISEEEITSPTSTLYKAEATGVGPGVASLQYDPITDTGYYGEVSSAQFYTGTQVSTACAVTSGTLQNDTGGWLKFYWHGQVLFIAKRTFRYNLSWDQINTANAVYGVNLGSTGKKTITHSGSSTSYDVKLMKGTVKDPSPNSGGGRQWNELLYRVCAGSEADEIGDNWATFNPSTDLGINSGSGSYTWCQEVYQPNTTNRVLRGGVSLSYFTSTESSSAGSGWRPCLALSR